MQTLKKAGDMIHLYQTLKKKQNLLFVLNLCPNNHVSCKTIKLLTKRRKKMFLDILSHFVAILG